MALSREQVVRAAVVLLDEVGLAGLSLRRLAAELGVSAPTLYWHVRDKRELLDLMAEAIVTGAPARSGSPRHGEAWWDWLTEQARIQWQALLAHRDAALVVAGNRPTDASLPLIEQTIGSLVSVGFPPHEALQSVLALGNYVVGCAVEHQAELARSAPADEATLDMMHRLADLPNLAAAARDVRAQGSASAFEHGLAILIRGLRARHAELTLTGADIVYPEQTQPTEVLLTAEVTGRDAAGLRSRLRDSTGGTQTGGAREEHVGSERG